MGMVRRPSASVMTRRGATAADMTRELYNRTMKFRQLADTGVFVSELCLGAMTFGGRGQQWQMIGGLGQSEVDAIVHRALEGGINFIDTADVYSHGESETMLGKAVADRRHEIVL